MNTRCRARPSRATEVAVSRTGRGVPGRERRPSGAERAILLDLPAAACRPGSFGSRSTPRPGPPGARHLPWLSRRQALGSGILDALAAVRLGGACSSAYVPCTPPRRCPPTGPTITHGLRMRPVGRAHCADGMPEPLVVITLAWPTRTSPGRRALGERPGGEPVHHRRTTAFRAGRRRGGCRCCGGRCVGGGVHRRTRGTASACRGQGDPARRAAGRRGIPAASRERLSRPLRAPGPAPGCCPAVGPAHGGPRVPACGECRILLLAWFPVSVSLSGGLRKSFGG